MVEELYGLGKAMVSAVLHTRVLLHPGKYESSAWSLHNGVVQGSGQGFSFGDEALGGDLQSKDSAPAIEPDVPGMIPAVQVEAPSVGNQNTADPNLFATHQREGHTLLPTRSGRKHRE